jgi:hypothetical protein
VQRPGLRLLRISLSVVTPSCRRSADSPCICPNDDQAIPLGGRRLRPLRATRGRRSDSRVPVGGRGDLHAAGPPPRRLGELGRRRAANKCAPRPGQTGWQPSKSRARWPEAAAAAPSCSCLPAAAPTNVEQTSRGPRTSSALAPCGLLIARRRSSCKNPAIQGGGIVRHRRVVSDALALTSPGEHARSYAALGVVTDRPHRDLRSVAGGEVASPSWGRCRVRGQRLTPDDGVLPPHVAGPARPV